MNPTVVITVAADLDSLSESSIVSTNLINATSVNSVLVSETQVVGTAVLTGAQGLQGIQGPTGATGPAGGVTSVNGSTGAVTVTPDKYYTTDFTSASTISVAHNLSKKPAVTLIDSAGDRFEGEVKYTDLNNLTVYLNYPTSGNVTCN